MGGCGDTSGSPAQVSVCCILSGEDTGDTPTSCVSLALYEDTEVMKLNQKPQSPAASEEKHFDQVRGLSPSLHRTHAPQCARARTRTLTHAVSGACFRPCWCGHVRAVADPWTSACPQEVQVTPGRSGTWTWLPHEPGQRTGVPSAFAHSPECLGAHRGYPSLRELHAPIGGVAGWRLPA